MIHGDQRDAFNLQFCVPSECARRRESGSADLGIVPVVEMARQQLLPIPGTGIACRGAVRSILLISKVEPSSIQSLAVDSGSRTSVALARIILRERHHCDPAILTMEPDLESMLAQADAALLIGDAALRVDPCDLPFLVMDLGKEWYDLTRLPMVFALWAGRPERVRSMLDRGADLQFHDSLQFGLSHMDAIVAAESARRVFPHSLVRDYLTRHIVFSIGPEEQKGLDTFLSHAAGLDTLVTSHQNAC